MPAAYACLSLDGGAVDYAYDLECLGNGFGLYRVEDFVAASQTAPHGNRNNGHKGERDV